MKLLYERRQQALHVKKDPTSLNPEYTSHLKAFHVSNGYISSIDGIPSEII